MLDTKCVTLKYTLKALSYKLSCLFTFSEGGLLNILKNLDQKKLFV